MAARGDRHPQPDPDPVLDATLTFHRMLIHDNGCHLTQAPCSSANGSLRIQRPVAAHAPPTPADGEACAAANPSCASRVSSCGTVTAWRSRCRSGGGVGCCLEPPAGRAEGACTGTCGRLPSRSASTPTWEHLRSAARGSAASATASHPYGSSFEDTVAGMGVSWVYSSSQ